MRISGMCLDRSRQEEDSGVAMKSVSVCSLTLLVTLEFGKGSIPVEDGPVEAQLVVQGLLGILQKAKKKKQSKETISSR